jgi:Domain of unknown function (DUF4349)
MDRSDDDTLLAELREMRPEPRPEFTAELDERAAAGFPRRASRSAKTPFARLLDRWRAMTPRRRLVPAVGFALAALVVATVVVATVGDGGGSGSSDLMTSAMSAESSKESAGGGGAAVDRNQELKAGPSTSGADEEAFEAEEEEAAPEEESGGALKPFSESTKRAGEKVGGEEGSSSGGEELAEEAPLEAESSSTTSAQALPPRAQALPQLSAPTFPRNGQDVFGHRDIERSASIVLGTKPGGVTAAASQVYKAVHAAHGIVLNSSVQSGSKGATGASFELLIPSRKLDDTLATFSQIAEVRERHDATNDITKPTVGAAEELADSNASIESLLKELGDSETETEREAVEARLREERRRHAAIEGSLEHLHKRASMSEVSVRIVTDHGAGVTPPAAKGDSGGWSVGDALHDAGHILQIAAGVLLIALAVLAPIALILLLVWLANRFRVRRLRERTLG